MLTAVVTTGAQINVRFVAADESGDHSMTFEESQSFCEFPFDNEADFEHGLAEGHPCEEGPSPLAPEPKELIWGGAAFIVLLVLMRVWLFPAVKKGMDARYAHIRGTHEAADAARAAARAEVAEYESALATVKAEAASRVEAARQTLEAERAARLAEVNAELNAKREAALAEAAQLRAAAAGDIAAAAREVTARQLELALGKAPDPAVVAAAVDQTMSAGVR